MYIIIVSSKPHVVQGLLQNVGSAFALKDLGSLHFFLDNEVNTVHNGIVLSQDKYASDLLKKTGMVMSKLVGTPLATRE
jgi:hypothetical protein